MKKSSESYQILVGTQGNLIFIERKRYTNTTNDVVVEYHWVEKWIRHEEGTTEGKAINGM